MAIFPLTFWPLVFHAQTKSMPIQNLSFEKGRDVNMVYKILEDSRGFMWFGTFDGLVLVNKYRYLRDFTVTKWMVTFLGKPYYFN